MSQWRSYVARVGAYLHKKVETDMFWDELLLWHHEAKQVHAETFGLFVSMFGAKP